MYVNIIIVPSVYTLKWVVDLSIYCLVNCLQYQPMGYCAHANMGTCMHAQVHVTCMSTHTLPPPPPHTHSHSDSQTDYSDLSDEQYNTAWLVTAYSTWYHRASGVGSFSRPSWILLWSKCGVQLIGICQLFTYSLRPLCWYRYIKAILWWYWSSCYISSLPGSQVSWRDSC